MKIQDAVLTTLVSALLMGMIILTGYAFGCFNKPVEQGGLIPSVHADIDVNGQITTQYWDSITNSWVNDKQTSNLLVKQSTKVEYFDNNGNKIGEQIIKPMAKDEIDATIRYSQEYGITVNQLGGNLTLQDVSKMKLTDVQVSEQSWINDDMLVKVNSTLTSAELRKAVNSKLIVMPCTRESWASSILENMSKNRGYIIIKDESGNRTLAEPPLWR